MTTIMNHPTFKIDDIRIVGLNHCKPSEIISYYKKNKEHLKNSMPLRDSSFYEEALWSDILSQYEKSFKEGAALKFILKDQNNVIGTISFDQIVHGVFQSCFLGYALDEDYQGQGIMTKALPLCINYVLGELKLNRIMANYNPNNHRSGKLLRRLGFEREGYARKYLKLNGEWQDHILTSLINDA